MSTPPSEAPARSLAAERWLLAVMAIFLLDVLIFLAGAMAAGTDRWNPGLLPIPHAVVLLLTVSFLTAQCGLAAVALGASRLAGYLKATLIATLLAAVWGVLLALLADTRLEENVAGSWLAALATQGTLAALGSFALQVCCDPGRIERSPQFTILVLIIWTTLVAAVLGGLRAVVQIAGWDSDVRQWLFFQPLQAVGTANAVLALLLYLVVWRQETWRRVAAYAGLATVATTTVFVVGMNRAFSDPGAESVDMCWLMVSQALYLLAVLVPVRAAWQWGRAASAARPVAGTISRETAPLPDSGR